MPWEKFSHGHGARLTNVDLPALLLRPARGVEGHVEYAILEVRLGGLRVDAFGQRDAAVEAAVAALAVIEAATLLAFFTARLALALQDELVTFQAEFHVFLLHAGKVRANVQLAAFLAHLDLRHPQRLRVGSTAPAHQAAAAAPDLMEQPV